jgi:hypothetical protein
MVFLGSGFPTNEGCFVETRFGSLYPQSLDFCVGFHACTSAVVIYLTDCLNVRVFYVRKTKLFFETRNGADAANPRVDDEAGLFIFCKVLHSIQKVVFQEHFIPGTFFEGAKFLIAAPLYPSFCFCYASSFTEISDTRFISSDNFCFSHFDLYERDWLACDLTNVFSRALKVKSEGDADSFFRVSSSSCSDLFIKLIEIWFQKPGCRFFASQDVIEG